MQLFPQNTSSAKNASSQAYSNNQAESAKGVQELKQASAEIMEIIATIMA